MRNFNKQIISLVVFILVGAMLLVVPLSSWAGTNRIQNPGLEPPFNKYGEWSGGGATFDLEVAHNWERFFIDSGTDDNGDDLRYFRSSAVEFLFGTVEKRDGDDAQLYWSTGKFDAGIYQQVSGLTIGENYGFQVGVLQVYGNTGNQTANKMFRSVGIDPTGGTDPTGGNVIWSPEDDGPNAGWFYPGVGAQAISTTMTIFVRVRSVEDAPSFEENAVWVDDSFMDVAPTTTLSLTANSATQVTANWSGAPRTGFNLFTYEAQYRKAGESAWIDLQIFDSSSSPNTNTNEQFTVEPGVEYVVRARTWHEEDGGDSHEVPGAWVEKTITVGGLVSGYVLDNQGNSVDGATVSVSASPTNTTTADDGSYSLQTGVGLFGLTADNGSGWTISHPISVTVPNLQTIAPLTITLRPPDDVISNGHFENGLTDWQSSGVAPTVSIAQMRSVSHSLQLSGNVVLSQTASISGGYKPVLSFWYKVAEGDGDDTLTAEILGPGQTATNSFNTSTVGNWQHAWLPLNQTDLYTGPVGVRFTLSQSGSPTQSVVYLDEVSLGSSQEVSTIFLPIVTKE